MLDMPNKGVIKELQGFFPKSVQQDLRREQQRSKKIKKMREVVKVEEKKS